MKRILLKGSWIVRAPRQEIYKIMSDFESWPKYFPKVADSARIIKKEGNNFEIEAKVKTFGRLVCVNMKTQLRPPLGFVSDNDNVGALGHEEFLMQEIPGGTKINYTYDVQLKNPIFRLFGRVLIGWYAMRFWKRVVIDKLKEMLEK